MALSHEPDVVGADLVAETPRAAVDHHADLPSAAQMRRRGRVVDPVDGLDLEEVVARAQAADLAQARVRTPGR